tara:strand:- start:27410 stop:32128 length:4719 start_codon:yes stop_codon:yes gene_type:complete
MSIKQTCLLAVPDNDPVKVCGVFQNFIKQYVDANPDYQEVFRKTLLLKQLRSDLLSDDASLVPFFDNAVGYLYPDIETGSTYSGKSAIAVPQKTIKSAKKLWGEFEMHGKDLTPQEIVNEEMAEEESEDVNGPADDIIVDTESAGKSLGEAGLDQFDVTYFKFIDKKLRPEEVISIYKSVKSSKGFYPWVDSVVKKYSMTFKNQKDEDSKVGKLLTFWNSHRKENERTRDAIPTFAFTNLDENLIDEEKDYDSQVRKARTANRRFIFEPSFDLKNRYERSKYVAKNIIESSKKRIRGYSMEDILGYFPLKNYGRIKKSGESNWFWEPSNQGIDGYKLNQWMIDFGNMSAVDQEGEFNTPFAMVAVTPGNSAEFLLTRILHEQVNDLFPANQVIDALKKDLLKMLNEGDASQQDIAYMRRTVEDINNIPAGESLLGWYKNIHYSFRDEHDKINNKVKVEDQDWTTEAKREFGDQALYRYLTIKNIYKKIDTAIKAVGSTNLAQYLQEQVNAGNMTGPQAKMFFKSANKLANQTMTLQGTRMPFITYLSSLISRHEFIQSQRGNDYLTHEDGNPYHLMTRLKLNKTKGLVFTTNESELEEGVPDNQNKTLYFDNTKVEYFYKDPASPDAGEVKIDPKTKLGANYDDGFTGSSTESLDRANYTSGSYAYPNDPTTFNPKAQKTVKVQLIDNADGSTSYVEMKHSKQEIAPGMIIRRKTKSGKPGAIVFKTVLYGEEVQIIDSKGNYIDDVAHGDSVKTATGDYSLDNKVSTVIAFEKMSERFINAPHNRGNATTYGPIQHASNLNYDTNTMNTQDKKIFENFRKVFKGIFKQQSDLYNDLLINSHQDPREARSMLKFLWSRTNDARDYVRDMLGASDGVGIHHENFMKKIRKMVINTTLKKGSLQARTSSPNISKSLSKGSSGTNLILEPDQKSEIKKPDSVILPSAIGGNGVIYEKVLNTILEGNNAVSQYVQERYTKKVEVSEGVFKDTKPKRKDLLSDNSLVNRVNDYLVENPQYILSYRSPIVDITAIEPRKIQKFANNKGNNIIHHKDDVDIRLVGDYDIDEAGVMTITQEQADELNKFFNSELYKSMEKNANLDFFLKDSDNNVASLSDFGQAWITVIKGMGLQGQATNLKSVASTLSMHYNEIKIASVTEEGKDNKIHTIVRPKKLNDRVVMDYAPIDPKATDAEILEGNPQAKIVFKDGKKYLETTVAHEYLLIINAATDYANKKQQGMIINMWGATNKNWFLERMFHIDKTPRKDGKLDDDAAEILNKIRKEYNYSKLKKLRTNNNNPMDLGKFYSKTKDLNNRLKMNKSDTIFYLRDTTSKTVNNAGNDVIKMQVEDIDYNEGVVTLDEEILTSMHNRIAERFPDGGDNLTPLLYNSERLEMTHYLSVKELWEALVQAKGPFKGTKITKTQFSEARKFANEFSNDFYGTFEELQNLAEEEQLAVTDIAYDEAKWNTTSKAITKLDKLVEIHGEGLRESFTVLMLSGMGAKKNITYLPPLKLDDRYLLSEKILVNYLTVWEYNLFRRDKDNKLESTKYDLRDSRRDQAKTYSADGLFTMINNFKKC